MDELFYLTLIWGGVFTASWLAQKTKLTSVLYCLALGSILVNLGIIPEQTPEFLSGFSKLGIIVIMFALGFEENTNTFIKSVKRSWAIAVFGALTPFATVYLLSLLLWDSQQIAILCGLAMGATTVSLSMTSLKNFNLHQSHPARGIMAAAVLDNIASLLLLAIFIPLVTGTGQFTLASMLFIMVKVIVFFSVVSVFGSVIFPREIRTSLLKHISFLRKFGIKDILSFRQGEKITLIILFVALATSVFGHWLGFHHAIGAYLAGLILKEEYFLLDANNKQLEQTKRVIDDIAFSWIGPVFFVVLGSQLVFDQEIFFLVIPETALLLICLVVAQISSAGLAARYTAKFNWPDSLLIGAGMLGRAELAFVVMEIGYVQYKILPKEVFYILMFTAFWLNILVPIGIKLWQYYFGSHQVK